MKRLAWAILCDCHRFPTINIHGYYKAGTLYKSLKFLIKNDYVIELLNEKIQITEKGKLQIFILKL